MKIIINVNDTKTLVILAFFKKMLGKIESDSEVFTSLV